jgi:hypothetical protein
VEDNTASLITSIKGGSSGSSGGSGGSSTPPPPPPPPSKKRQADKYVTQNPPSSALITYRISNGAAAVLDAAGANAAGDAVKTNGDSIDGELTSAAANAGAQVGSTEESTLESIGSSVPKRFRRQADK